MQIIYFPLKSQNVSSVTLSDFGLQGCHREQGSCSTKVESAASALQTCPPAANGRAPSRSPADRRSPPSTAGPADRDSRARNALPFRHRRRRRRRRRHGGNAVAMAQEQQRRLADRTVGRPNARLLAPAEAAAADLPPPPPPSPPSPSLARSLAATSDGRSSIPFRNLPYRSARSCGGGEHYLSFA